LLVGKTTQGLTNAGFEVAQSGQASITQSGASALRLNRLSSDGELLQFRKDGSTVGSIGTSSSRLHIENGDTGLRIAGDLDQIFPCGSGGGDRDAAIDLGSTGVRFKDLYLSGSIEIENGTGNVGVGKQALNSNTGSDNSAFGKRSLYSNTSGSKNLALGKSAGYNNTEGTSNTFVGAPKSSTGYGSGYFMTTGSNNTILGAYNGNQGGLDIRTSDNNIVLSDGDGNPRLFYKTATVNWNLVVPAASNNALIVHNTGGSSPYGILIDNDLDANNSSNWFINATGDTTSRFKVYTNGNVVNTNNSYGSISDVKLKENIIDSSSQWDDIKALTVRKYSMKADNLDAPNMIGVIAQEVEAAGMGGLVFETPDATPDNPDAEGTTKQVNYSILYMKAVKALQEAMDRIETLEAKVTALENA